VVVIVVAVVVVVTVAWDVVVLPVVVPVVTVHAVSGDAWQQLDPSQDAPLEPQVLST